MASEAPSGRPEGTLAKLAIPAAGILLLASAAILAIASLTGDPRPQPAAPETIQAPPPPPGVPPEPPPVPTTPAEALAPREPPEASPPVQYDEAPEPPPPGSWEAITPVARAGSLGPAGAAVARGINQLAAALGACRTEAAGRGGLVAPTDNYTETREEAPPPDEYTTILVLQVETLAEHVQIVEAPVESQGQASYGQVACAQRVLRGQVFPAPGVKAGVRYRILHTLR